MIVLVFNAGSSSLKVALFDGDRTLLKLGFDRFGAQHCMLVCSTGEGGGHAQAHPARDIAQAVAAVPGLLAQAGLPAPQAIGHRIAHGGQGFTAPARLDAERLAQIDQVTPLAPLHNPANLGAARHAMQVWPDVPQVGVFDTAFHATLPARATTYAVPQEWRDAGLRRYGFHGTSHKYVAMRAGEALGRDWRTLRIISLHLGNGASACAVAYGRSVDTSMGLTPLEGLVMGTRPGDMDAGAFGFLERALGLSVAQIEVALNGASGLKGLTGTSDLREIEARAANGDSAAQAAITLTAYRARKYLGAYAAAMGGVDAVVFTGGIGENSASMRARICDGLDFMGLRLDPDRNAAPDLRNRAAPQVQDAISRVTVLVTETAEALQIARDVAELLARDAPKPAPIPVAVSGRHVHLCADAVRALFGPDYTLTPATPLRQPGNWAAAERISIAGPRGTLENVAILCPLRLRTQIEVSRTDTFALGVDAPVRDSGQLEGTPRVRLIGPAGIFETDGLIVAARHIHITPDDAHARGLRDGDLVRVQITGDGARGVIFDHVLIRVSPKAFTEMHIDTDEANAAGLRSGAEGAVLRDVAAQTT
ncbi:MAG: acetate/propionate family kinase [Roseinatronobacter sp.]